MDVGFNAVNSAILDTGAMATMITADSVNPNYFLPYPTHPVEVKFGQGKSAYSESSVSMGPFESIVVPNLSDNLFSVDEVVNSGSILMLNAQGGVIYNEENHSTIRVYRDENTWKVWLTDVRDYEFPSSDLRTRQGGVVSVKRVVCGENVILRYIQLHLRMAHASAKNIVKALAKSDWKNCNLTEEQVRRASKSWRCPDCCLAKLRRKSISKNLHSAGERI